MSAFSLKEFVPRAFESLGAVVERESGDARVDVLLPEHWLRHFDSEFLSIPLTEAQLHSGTPILGKIIEAIATQGNLAKAYLNPLRLEVSGLEQKLLNQFHFSNLRASVSTQHLEETAHAIVHCKVSYLTDDREERLYRAALNLTTLAEHERLADEYAEGKLFLDAAQTYPGLAFQALPAIEKMNSALEFVLRRLTAPDVDKYQSLQKKLVSRDLDRIERYFDAMREESVKKEVQHAGNEAIRLRETERRRAIELDRQKKRLDIREKFRLSITSETVNVLLVFQPWIRAVAALTNRSSAIERSYFWDPVFKCFMPAPCDVCQRPSFTFLLADAQLLCPACS